MAIANATCTRLGRTLWRLYAESDSVSQATFYIWFDGIITKELLGIALTGGGWYVEYDFTVPEYGDVDVSIFDENSSVPTDIYPGKSVIQFEADSDASEYWIEEYVDAAWVVRKVVRETGQWMYDYTTRQLEDDTDHSFRIRAQGGNEEMSEGRAFILRCVRRPDRPSMTYTFELERLAATGWTAVNWTGSWVAGWAHTTGNTSVLSNTLVAVSAVEYTIAYTVTGRTAGTFVLTFGGQTSGSISATGEWEPTTSSTAAFTCTPTSDFDGTIVFSIVKKGVLTVSAA